MKPFNKFVLLKKNEWELQRDKKIPSRLRSFASVISSVNINGDFYNLYLMPGLTVSDDSGFHVVGAKDISAIKKRLLTLRGCRCKSCMTDILFSEKSLLTFQGKKVLKSFLIKHINSLKKCL